MCPGGAAVRKADRWLAPDNSCDWRLYEIKYKPLDDTVYCVARDATEAACRWMVWFLSGLGEFEEGEYTDLRPDSVRELADGAFILLPPAEPPGET